MNHPSSRLIALVAAALAVAACSSGTPATPPAPPIVIATPAATAPATAAPTSVATPAGTPVATPVAASSVLGVTAAPASPTPAAQNSGLAGLWTGTWQDTFPDASSGSFQVTFTQANGTLAGTIVVKGTPCLTNGTVTGTVSGSKINFGAVSGRIQIAYDGTISGNKMQGTYSAPVCAEAKGNWTATKS